jgi:hypothetical protein
LLKLPSRQEQKKVIIYCHENRKFKKQNKTKTVLSSLIEMYREDRRKKIKTGGSQPGVRVPP